MIERRAAWIALLVSGLLVLSALGYVAAYLWLPSDGTMIDVVAIPSQPGLFVEVYRSETALKPGDLVTAMDGQTIDTLLAQALRQPLGRPAAAGELAYTVVRAGQTLSVRQALLSPPVGAVLRQNWTIFFFLFYLELVGIVVFALRPRLPVARLLLLFASTIFASSWMFFLGLPLSALRHGWMVWLWLWGALLVYGFLAGNGLLFTMVFPRLWPAIARRRAWALVLYAVVWLPFLAHVALDWYKWTGASAHFLLILRATSTMSVVVFPLAMVASYISYRHTQHEAERRQVRWVLWGIVVAILPWALLTALPQALGLTPILPPLLVGLLWCALPTAFAIAILRERLFDIDVIINRSLVYGGLSLVLAAAYFGGVVVLQSLFITLTGEQQSQLATVLSTLAIAVLFSPLRQRLQQSVDRRFFRRKYDAARILAAFGANVRDEVELNTLTQRLMAAVQDALEPAHTWLWLRPAAGPEVEPAMRGRER